MIAGAVLPLILVLAAAVACQVGDARTPRAPAGGGRRRRGAQPEVATAGPWRAVPAALVVAALIVEITAGSALGGALGGLLRQDRFSLFCDILLLVAALVAVLGAASLPGGASGSALVPVTVLAGMVTAAAGDAVVLWLGLAVAAAAPLVGVRREGGRLAGVVPPTPRAAVERLGGLLPAAAGLALFGRTGPGGLPGTAAGVLVLVGLGALAASAISPLRTGDETRGGAPGTTVGALAGGLGAAVPVIAILEVLGPPASGAAWAPLLLGAAAVALAAGALVALAARSPARLAAGLAAGQLGWLLAGLASHHQPSAGAAIYLLGAYAVALAGIPRAAGTGLRAPFRASAGLGGRDPARAVALTLGVLSLAGMPPLGGWFGEFAVAAQLARVGHLWLFGLGLVQFLAGSIGALRLAGLVYLSPPPEEAARVERHPLATASAATLAVFLLAYGVFANPVDGLALQGAAALGLR